MAFDHRQVTDHVIRLAALHTPKQLKSKAVLLVLAFLFQHECVLQEVRQAQIDVIGDPDCYDPASVVEDLQHTMHALITDGTTLNSIYELLATVDDNFDRASPPVIKEVVDHMHRAMDDTAQRERLERLFSYPTESDEHPA